MAGEFELIREYFQCPFSEGDNVAVGIGDDAAVSQLPIGQQLVTTVDTLVSGVHFPPETSPFDIGYKSLAVSLSDLAAMAAKPEWFTLALTLPENDSSWLQQFSRGLSDIAQSSGISLIGGDTTRGPLTISVQAMGSVPQGKAVLRSGASVDDDVYVTGSLGDAAAGLAVVQQRHQFDSAENAYLIGRLNRPTPRTLASLELRDQASAMIDCSDGLLADLGHIIEASTLGAQLRLSDLPLSAGVKQFAASHSDYSWPLAGGDDYELIFTAPVSARMAVQAIAANLAHPVSCIGKIVSQAGIRVEVDDGSEYLISSSGFQHF